MCETRVLSLHSVQFLFLHFLQPPSMSKHFYVGRYDRKHIEGHQQKCLKQLFSFLLPR